jgi:hypothetical protein
VEEPAFLLPVQRVIGGFKIKRCQTTSGTQPVAT